jgi:hypothetical protein
LGFSTREQLEVAAGQARKRHYGIFVDSQGKKIAPLIFKQTDLLGELDITFIRQQQPGQLVKQGGDIDIRIKMLFDALRDPTNSARRVSSVR